ncbi:hypothetical protein F5880DRAFT_1754362 [Lentinula raphanica]|nr:hypothetical protein F5880DRAFT_1754362 [Lentinula raphanica]
MTSFSIPGISTRATRSQNGIRRARSLRRTKSTPSIPQNSSADLNLDDGDDILAPSTIDLENIHDSFSTPSRTQLSDSIPLGQSPDSPVNFISGPPLVLPTPKFHPSLANHMDPAHQKGLRVLSALKKEGLRFGEFVEMVLNQRNPCFELYRAGFFRPDSQFFVSVLDHISRSGGETFRQWVEPLSLDLICSRINSEFLEAEPMLYMAPSQVSADTFSTWSIRDMFGDTKTLGDQMPLWNSILRAATDRDLQNDRPPSLVMNVVTAQLLNLRSQSCIRLQSMFGIFAWATGCSKKLIEVLSQSGLSVSFPSIQKYIAVLSARQMDRARSVPRYKRLLGYDNLNISTSIYIEQRPDAPAKVQSGTFPIIYELYFRVADPIAAEIMQLKPILDSFRNAGELKYADIEPSFEQTSSYLTQTKVTLIQTLFKLQPVFQANGIDYSSITYTPRHPIPLHTTIFHPLQVTITEEASIEGNLRIPDEIFISQLQDTSAEMSRFALPSINDQLTNDRIRSCQLIRQGDINEWECCLPFALGIGELHLCMNFSWCLLNCHRFDASQIGSLASYFEILDKKRLGAEKSDYYTLQAALFEVRDALILNAWRDVAARYDHNDLECFAASGPSTEDLLRYADIIMLDFASPIDSPIPADAPGSPLSEESDMNTDVHMHSPPASDSSLVDADDVLDPALDPINQNARLLLHDLLYLTELILAIAEGDFGWIEDILSNVAAIFCGAGSHKYTTEILHALYNFKKVWSKEFADVMRDNHLVNVSGLPGHFMALDMNTEHLILYLKQLFASKGLYSTWDRLSDISPAISEIQKIKKHFGIMLGVSWKNHIHRDANTHALVFRLAEKIKALQIQQYQPNHTLAAVPAPDLLQVGWSKLASGVLVKFNEKLRACRENRFYEDTVEPVTRI